MKKIVDLSCFASAKNGIPAEEWLNTSLIIDFKEFGNDNNTKALAVALILNFLIKRLNKNLSVKSGIQPLKMILFVDEAHLLFPKESKAGLLGSLAPDKGDLGAFPLASITRCRCVLLRLVRTRRTLPNCSLRLHFSPETLSEGEQRQILGALLSHPLKQGEAAVRLHKKRRTGKRVSFGKQWQIVL